MKLSIIIPVLNSHEIVRRQLLHFNRIGVPEDTELILVDDGSAPPIQGEAPFLRIHRTHDYRPWTWALARNVGARIAQGEYLLMVDLDYILPRDAIDAARNFNADKMRFKREFGILDENGVFSQDPETLLAYGLLPERLRTKGTKMPPHPNNFVMRKDLYWEIGGYREDLTDRPYPQGEDRYFKQAWVEWQRAGKCRDSDYRPTIYMFPNGQFCGDVDHNPFHLFHDLSRKTDRNPWYAKQLEAVGQ